MTLVGSFAPARQAVHARVLYALYAPQVLLCRHDNNRPRSLCYPNLTIPRRRPGEAVSLCGRFRRVNHSRAAVTPLQTCKHQMIG
jgi:hypothetical protein